ncbi:hypothetical protein VF21_02762 [Pseudogymnoascus sp. 05NY08]|nr:hypothetical protein VF21_02762 [Pseudogymnoascus sp. 05NY08]
MSVHRDATLSNGISAVKEKESESEKWSPSPAALKDLIPSSIMPTNDEETSTQGPATPEYPTLSLLGSVRPMAIDIASLTDVERYLYLALAADESADIAEADQPSTAICQL